MPQFVMHKGGYIGLSIAVMVNTQPTVAVTAVNPDTWQQQAELIRPPRPESLMSSLSNLLSGSTSSVPDRPMPSQQARRKRRKKRRKNRNALDLLSGNGSTFRDNAQSDYSFTSSTTASSDTEDRRSRPGTPTANSILSPVLSPIMSPAMEPILVDELEGMDALGLGHALTNGSSGTTTTSHRESYVRRKDTSIVYARISDSTTNRPCSPLRIGHLLERTNSVERVIEEEYNGSDDEDKQKHNNATTKTDQLLPHHLSHPLAKELSINSRSLTEPSSITNTMDPLKLTKELLTLSLNDNPSTPPPDSAISFCAAQANTNDIECSTINASRLELTQNDLLHSELHENEMCASGCEGDNDDYDDEEDEEDYEDEEHLYYYEEDSIEYDDNSIIEAELDDDVPELPSLINAGSAGHRTNSLGNILKTTKQQHNFVHEWPSDNEDKQDDDNEEDEHLKEENGLFISDNNNNEEEEEEEENSNLEVDTDDCHLIRKPLSVIINNNNNDDEMVETTTTPSLLLLKEQDDIETADELLTTNDMSSQEEAVLHSPRSIRQLDEDMSSDDMESTWAPSNGFARVRSQYLAQQNLMLERELGHARNTAHALREIVRFQEDRLREAALLNDDLRDKVRRLEVTIARELADIQQRRHQGLPNHSRKRMSIDMLRRRREEKPISLSSFCLDREPDEDEQVETSTSTSTSTSAKTPTSNSLWKVASPEPPMTREDVQCLSATATTPPLDDTVLLNNNVSDHSLTTSANTTTTALSSSPSNRRDLAAIWRDLRAEKVIAIPTEDEGYGSGHSKETPIPPKVVTTPTTITTATTTTTTTATATSTIFSSPPSPLSPPLLAQKVQQQQQPVLPLSTLTTITSEVTTVPSHLLQQHIT
ncbi:hypothetical protein BDF19DRAFT_426579 [Syncephalis fuscata]|nr:hypothetical protein BDF19DRAFT_426579 [Syncephalis fuscata]